MKTALGVYPRHREQLPPITLDEGGYEAAFARSAGELDAIQRLRFEVFNLEMGEGLEGSYVSGRDADEFDPVCHHLKVTDPGRREIVGTYRMQTAAMAEANLGFYSSGLFDLSGLAGAPAERSIEIGRACVAKPHRTAAVLFLLWKGLGAYLMHNRARYLFGCCSLTSQDPAEGSAVLRFLEQGGRMHPEWSIRPQPAAVCPIDRGVEAARGVPTLFRTYLRFGAKVCGPPAIDREFKTIDFFVVLDIDELSPGAKKMFLG